MIADGRYVLEDGTTWSLAGGHRGEFLLLRGDLAGGYVRLVEVARTGPRLHELAGAAIARSESLRYRIAAARQRGALSADQAARLLATLTELRPTP